jgi:hypothetical protein
MLCVTPADVTAAAFIEIIEAILQARFPAACRLSRSKRFRLKAAECLQLADNAVNAQPQEIYTDLARCYERLATHAEAIERHRYEKLLNRFPFKR